MSSWDFSSFFDEDTNESYVSESVWTTGVDRGEKEVVSVLRCDDGSGRPILPDLNEVFIDEGGPSSYEDHSYPHHVYGTYRSKTGQQHNIEYEEGAKDFEENDKDVDKGVMHFEEWGDDKDEGFDVNENEEGANEEVAKDRKVEKVWHNRYLRVIR